jgi:hypothetical protein
VRVRVRVGWVRVKKLTTLMCGRSARRRHTDPSSVGEPYGTISVIASRIAPLRLNHARGTKPPSAGISLAKSSKADAAQCATLIATYAVDLGDCPLYL